MLATNGNPSFDSSSECSEIVVQVVDLKPISNRYTANDGKTKMKHPSMKFSWTVCLEVFVATLKTLQLLREIFLKALSVPMDCNIFQANQTCRHS
ncbi:hypothetical protein HID58_035203 [Brassica napus]|uniref:Uncharacterized protein n=1 Tax=Brassica napus TaxID=3708 RepID=A0ABQ8C482_BRANA|nr:hypothetical protein HID58_035203 [Brassica napus]